MIEKVREFCHHGDMISFSYIPATVNQPTVLNLFIAMKPCNPSSLVLLLTALSCLEAAALPSAGANDLVSSDAGSLGLVVENNNNESNNVQMLSVDGEENANEFIEKIAEEVISSNEANEANEVSEVSEDQPVDGPAVEGQSIKQAEETEAVIEEEVKEEIAEAIKEGEGEKEAVAEIDEPKEQDDKEVEFAEKQSEKQEAVAEVSSEQQVESQEEAIAEIHEEQAEEAFEQEQQSNQAFVEQEPEVIEKCAHIAQQEEQEFTAPSVQAPRQSSQILYKSNAAGASAPRRSMNEIIAERRDKGVNFESFQFYDSEDAAAGEGQLKMGGVEQYNEQYGDYEDGEESYNNFGSEDDFVISQHEGKHAFALEALQKNHQPQNQQQNQNQKPQKQRKQRKQRQNQQQNNQHQHKQALNARELQKMQEARQSARYSARSARSINSNRNKAHRDVSNAVSELSGVKLSFCESAALGVIANFRLMGLKFPMQANSLERQKSAQYLISLVNSFPCEKEQAMMKHAMIVHPPIYSDRRNFNKWVSQFSKNMIKAMNSPVSLDLNSALVPLKNKK